MPKHRALMLWTDAWVADTAHLTRCERGTYLDLLVLMWRTPGCRVPNDDAWLGRRLRMTAEEVRSELRPIIAEFCQSDGNHLYQKRLTHEHKWSHRISQRQSVRAKSRWNNKKDQCRGNATRRNASVSVSVPVSVTNKKEEVLRTSSAARAIPPDFEPDRELARSKGWTESKIDDEVAAFRDHALAKGRLAKDWQAAWRNWVRSPYQNVSNGGQNGSHRQGRNGRPTTTDAINAIIERLEGRDARDSEDCSHPHGVG